MSHHAKVCATYRLNTEELVQVVVGISANYPDALAEARAVAVAGIHDLLDDIYARERVAVQADE